MRGLLGYFKRVFISFGRDEATVRASSLAFYASLSLAPLVLLFVSITSMIGEGAQERMVGAVDRTAGAAAADGVRMLAAEQSGAAAGGRAGWSMAIGLAVILFSASGAVAAMQYGLNRVWNVKPRPGAAVKNFVRKRLLSMGMVLALAFFLLVSTVASTVLTAVTPGDGLLWDAVTLAVSAMLLTVLFGAVFKVLPDVRIAWRDVWFGAAATTVLFIAGKWGISLYLARASFEDRYGAAGTIIAVLVWVYYSALILYLGAEMTQVSARDRGRQISPDRHAVRVEEVVAESDQP